MLPTITRRRRRQPVVGRESIRTYLACFDVAGGYRFIMASHAEDWNCSYTSIVLAKNRKSFLYYVQMLLLTQAELKDQ